MREMIIVLLGVGLAIVAGPTSVARGQGTDGAVMAGSSDGAVLRCAGIELGRSTTFKVGGYVPDAGGHAVLDKVAALLMAHDWVERLRIEVHSDATGRAAFNRRMTAKRAEHLVVELNRRGVGVERLEAHGAGEAEPVASNDSAAGRAENRRIVLAIVAGDCPWVSEAE